MSKCRCKNVDFGSYANVILMKLPKDDYLVSIDTCIASEIGYLWHEGVRTFGSCCGHGKIEPTVVVSGDSIEKMHELGYKPTTLSVARPEQTFVL